MEQEKIVLCDTDVIIEFYKNNAEIVKALKNIGQENIMISTVTAAELIFGARNKLELNRIKKDINSLLKLDIDSSICSLLLELMSKYALSHKLAIPDGIIAASALVNNVELFTMNKKDFKFIEGLKLFKHLN